VRRFSFPPQEHRFTAGQTAFDSVTGRGWSVLAVDDEHGTIDLKISRNYSGPLPPALVEGGPVDTSAPAHQLRDLGDRIARDGLTGQDAATALLLRLRPSAGSIPGTPLRPGGESSAAAAMRLVPALHASYLPIQGPPGTGKTYNAANQILELTAHGHSVGITGPSHAVIHNLIRAILERAASRELPVRVGQKADPDNPYLHSGAERMTNDKLALALSDGEIDVAAGTIWMWSRQQFAGSVDTLFVDEAGDILGQRRAPRPGVSLRSPPAERRDLTSQGHGHHRRQPRPSRRALPDTTPDAPGQRPVPGLGNRRMRRLPGAAWDLSPTGQR
jgi:hypothetical protein